MLSAVANRLNHALLYETRPLPFAYIAALGLLLFVTGRAMAGAISDDARLAGYALAGLTVLFEKFRQHLAKQAVEADFR